MVTWTFICNHTIMQSYAYSGIMTHSYTGIWTHTYIQLIFLGRMHAYYAVKSETNNANFVHQVASLNPLKYWFPLRVPDWVSIPRPPSHKASMLAITSIDADNVMQVHPIHEWRVLTEASKCTINRLTLIEKKITFNVYSVLWSAVSLSLSGGCCI